MVRTTAGLQQPTRWVRGKKKFLAKTSSKIAKNNLAAF